VVLVSFGGFGLDGLPLDAVAARRHFTVVTTSAPRAEGAGGADAALVSRTRAGTVVVDERALYTSGVRYEDLVAAADVVVTKPGYGIVAECIANGPAVLYTSRGPFAEYDVLVREMPRYLRCHFIDQAALRAGRWETALEALLEQSLPPERARTDGADVVARRALALLDSLA
jgi:L-arabinokinase